MKEKLRVFERCDACNGDGESETFEPKGRSYSVDLCEYCMGSGIVEVDLIAPLDLDPPS